VPLAPVVILCALFTAERVRPPDGAEIAALMVIVLAAFNVSVDVLVQLSGSETVMVPALPPLLPLFVVVTVILLFARPLSNVVVLIVEVAEPELGS